MGLFVSLIMFDFVRKPNKNTTLNYLLRKTETCNEYKTNNFKGTFHDFQQNRKLFYPLFYLVTTDCKTSVANDNGNFFLYFHSTIWFITDEQSTSVRHIQIPRLLGQQGEFFLRNLSRQFILTVQRKVRKSNVQLHSMIGQFFL